MSSPTRRPSGAYVPAIGPSSSLLQQLLQEINDNDAPRSDPILANGGTSLQKASPNTSRKASLNCTISPSQNRSSSVWARGGLAAEDARQKLRAFDEARLCKNSVTAAQHDNPKAPPPDLVSRKSSITLPSPPFFTEVQYSRAATFPRADLPSPRAEHAINFTQGKRDRSGAYSPDFITKKLRQESFPDMTCRDREYHCADLLSDDFLRGGGSMVTTQVQSANPDDPVLQLGSPGISPSPPSPQNGFRSTPKHAYTPFRPATPRRSPTPSDGGSLGGTPTWLRPLYLVEDDFSIYKNVHGDKSRDHPLCLYCFRKHGEFHRVISHRCEVCGQSEVLEGHYWEAPLWA